MDVFQVVKALRVQKPGAVRTVVSVASQHAVYSVCVLYVIVIVSVSIPFIPLQAQYCVIFEAVLLFLDSFETYSNF